MRRLYCTFFVYQISIMVVNTIFCIQYHRPPGKYHTKTKTDPKLESLEKVKKAKSN